MSARTLAIAIALLAAACHGSHDPAAADAAADASSDGPSDALVHAACAHAAHARCARLQSCAPARIARAYGDVATCEARASSACASGLRAPSTADTPAAVEACAQVYDGWACRDLLDGTNAPAPCARRSGPLPSNVACGFDAQCRSGFCALRGDAECGVCATLPGEGTSCAAYRACGPGLTCATDTQRCVPFAAEDAPCGPGAPCGAGLSCASSSGDAGTSGRTCQPATAVAGASCDAAGAGCDRDQGLTCDRESGRCVPAPAAAPGRPCTDDGLDRATFACAASGRCAGGSCLASAPDNTACDTLQGPFCMPPSRCVSISDGGPAGLCRPPTSTCL